MKDFLPPPTSPELNILLSRLESDFLQTKAPSEVPPRQGTLRFYGSTLEFLGSSARLFHLLKVPIRQKNTARDRTLAENPFSRIQV